MSSQAGRKDPSPGPPAAPANEHRGTFREKTQEGTFLAPVNRERPSGRPPISTRPPDTFLALPWPLQTRHHLPPTTGVGPWQHRLTQHSFSEHFHELPPPGMFPWGVDTKKVCMDSPNESGFMGSGFQGALHWVSAQGKALC